NSLTIQRTIREKKHCWGKERKKLFTSFFKKHSYNNRTKEVEIDKALGLEYNVGEFLDKAQEFIEHNHSELIFNLSKCPRIWPSAVTLFCSLVQWCQLTTVDRRRPELGSIRPKDNTVHSYLSHCGFYDYVQAKPIVIANEDPNHEKVVKIRREEFKRNVDERHSEIIKLVKDESLLNAEELEIFNDRILPEILNNVLEHGVHGRDSGWFNLAQYHPTTGIISICIADNGMGIKNTLITGPQRNELIKTLPKEDANDGNAIEKAFEKNVSGAFTASNKNKKLLGIRQYERGSRRGNGLVRIKDNCKCLSIPLIILSQKGALVIDKNGNMEKPYNLNKKVFAGTLYHLQVPAKKKT
ncbi:MAG: hypothetical protein HY559_00475, partial [Gammaproteobacteria bacterium]|nr:hypothetical protein [Gammaproteobacteria bacterium]